jgi:hypothetical protein
MARDTMRTVNGKIFLVKAMPNIKAGDLNKINY